MEGFIGVHLGAGQHSENLKPEYKKLVSRACRKAIAVLKAGGSAVNACSEATAVLEDSPLTNAGFGSNLTWSGEVECDASIMDGSTLHYGAVGAVSGVKNPVHLAEQLCERQKFSLSLGRVPPSFLVGEGAKSYAVKSGIVTVPPRELIAAQSWKLYQHYRKKVKRFHESSSQISGDRLDTVGAVCVDSSGHVAASCSSGGIALKTTGRVGQAGVYACGVWAQDAIASSPAVAACTSGCGEHLIRTMLAREGALSVLSGVTSELSLHECMTNKFLYSPSLQDVDEKMGGIFILKYNPNHKAGELLWSHSTSTMCIGYMSAKDSKLTCRVSRMSERNQCGRSIVVEGIKFECQAYSNKRPASFDGSDTDNITNGHGEEEEDDDDDEEEEIIALSGHYLQPGHRESSHQVNVCTSSTDM